MAKSEEKVEIHEVYKNQMIDFGKLVSVKRKEAGQSLDELAKITGIDKSYISRLEKGERSNPSFVTVFVLSKAFGIDLRDIIKEV